jgi:hypothetical protein
MLDVDDDWRLQGQERYLSGVRLIWKDYREWSPDWEHDHCAFCRAKFMNRDDVPDVLQAGYAAQGAGPNGEDDYHWVCAVCAREFTERFGWTVVGGPHPTI